MFQLHLLPNEIIVNIFDHLRASHNDRELVELARANKRLYEIFTTYLTNQWKRLQKPPAIFLSSISITTINETQSVVKRFELLNKVCLDLLNRNRIFVFKQDLSDIFKIIKHSDKQQQATEMLWGQIRHHFFQRESHEKNWTSVEIVAWAKSNKQSIEAITRIDLSNQNLPCLPLLLCLFKNLRELNLLETHAHTYLHLESSRYVLSHLKNLENLDLSNNSLKNLPENIFDDLTKLSELDLSDNSIKVIQNGIFGKLENLTELFLSYNDLSAIEENAFDGLIQLTKLHLNNNNLEKLSHGLFKNLSQIHTISLYQNPTLTQIPQEIGDMTLFGSLTTFECTNFEALDEESQTLLIRRFPQMRDIAASRARGRAFSQAMNALAFRPPNS